MQAALAIESWPSQLYLSISTQQLSPNPSQFRAGWLFVPLHSHAAGTDQKLSPFESTNKPSGGSVCLVLQGINKPHPVCMALLLIGNESTKFLALEGASIRDHLTHEFQQVYSIYSSAWLPNWVASIWHGYIYMCMWFHLQGTFSCALMMMVQSVCHVQLHLICSHGEMILQ